MYGYLKDPENKNRIIVDPFASEVVRAIFKWKIEGMSQGRIADRLNAQGVLCPLEYKKSIGVNLKSSFQVHKKAKWSAVSVERILKNEIYIQNILKRDIRISPEEEVVYPLSGYVRCGDCHQNMIRKSFVRGKKRYRYFICSTHKHSKDCSTHSISVDELTESVLNATKRHIEMVLEMSRMIDVWI